MYHYNIFIYLPSTMAQNAVWSKLGETKTPIKEVVCCIKYILDLEPFKN